MYSVQESGQIVYRDDTEGQVITLPRKFFAELITIEDPAMAQMPRGPNIGP